MDKNLIFSLYKESIEQAKNIHNSIILISNLIIAISIGCIGIISIDKTLTLYDLPFALLVSILGLFGIIFTLKYNIHRIFFNDLSKKYLSYISKELYTEFIKQEESYIENYTLMHQNKYKIKQKYINKIYKIPLVGYWVFLHLYIFIIGIIMIFLISLKGFF